MQAQSVPTASVVPGLRPLQPGWDLGSANVRNGWSRVTLIRIDLSAELVKRAELLSPADQPNLSFRVADVYDLPFPGASFERVTATQVMLHLADPWKAFTELRYRDRPPQGSSPAASPAVIEWGKGAAGLRCS